MLKVMVVMKMVVVVMKMMFTAALSYSLVDCGPHKCSAVDFRVIGCLFSNNICLNCECDFMHQTYTSEL